MCQLVDISGTGNTLTFSCYKTELERSLNGVLSRYTTNSSDTAPGTLWGVGKIVAGSCAANAAEYGGLIGTAFGARDTMQVVDALNEDGLVRYWGLSYGTVLGATIAAMFPDRVDRMILDGVLNPHEYYNGWDVEWYTDTDKVFSEFLSACVRNPNECVLARENATAANLESSVFRMLDEIKYHPIPLAGTLIEYSLVKRSILALLYVPTQWSLLGLALDALVTRKLDVLEVVVAELSANPLTVDKEALSGIRCSDKSARASTLEDFQPTIDKLHVTSKVAGDTFSWIFMQCAQWNMTAKERYIGDFRVRTRNPILVIGNTFDPVTPLISARNVSSGFEGSVVLQHDGYGHSSLAQPSVCTLGAIQSFLNGTMPEPGTVCKPDLGLFEKAPPPSETPAQ